MLKYGKYFVVLFILFSLIASSVAYAKKPIKLSSKQMAKTQGAIVPVIVVAAVGAAAGTYAIACSIDLIGEQYNYFSKHPEAVDAFADRMNFVNGIDRGYRTLKGDTTAQKEEYESARRALDEFNQWGAFTGDTNIKVMTKTENIVAGLAGGAGEMAGLLIRGGEAANIAVKGDQVVVESTKVKGAMDTVKIAESPFVNKAFKETAGVIGKDFAKSATQSIFLNSTDVVGATQSRMVSQYSSWDKLAVKGSEIFVPAIGAQASDDFRNGVYYANQGLLGYGEQSKYFDAAKGVLNDVNLATDKTGKTDNQCKLNNSPATTSTMPPKTTTTFIASNNSGGSGGGGGGNRTGGSGGSGGGSGGSGGSTTASTSNSRSTASTPPASSSNTVSRASPSNVSEAHSIAVSATPTNNLSNASATTRAMMSGRN